MAEEEKINARFLSSGGPIMLKTIPDKVQVLTNAIHRQFLLRRTQIPVPIVRSRPKQ